MVWTLVHVAFEFFVVPYPRFVAADADALTRNADRYPRYAPQSRRKTGFGFVATDSVIDRIIRSACRARLPRARADYYDYASDDPDGARNVCPLSPPSSCLR
jgi:hypothetical protein